MKNSYITCFSLIVFANSFCIGQNSNSVFRILASKCAYNETNPEKTNYSTGFLYKKDGITKGVITTLHGVCGCNSIKAEDSYGNTISLSISKIDIDRDIALLSSNQLFSKYTTEGFDFSKLSYSALQDKPVLIYGSPFGSQAILKISNGKINDPSNSTLEYLIGNDNKSIFAKKALKDRHSPELFMQMLVLEAAIAPGCSGSPIIINKEVVGIANGSVGQGFTHSWATPVSNLDSYLKEPSTWGSRYENLKNNNPNGIFLLTCNLGDNSEVTDWNDNEYPGSTMLICPGKIPRGWVVIDQKKCTCCSPKDFGGIQWTIKKVKGMESGSEFWVCANNSIPKNWVVIDKESNCDCCIESGNKRVKILNANNWKKFIGTGNFHEKRGEWICSDSDIPENWVVADINYNSSCCPSASYRGTWYYIKNLNGMPVGSFGRICAEKAYTPPGWSRTQEDIPCSCCGYDNSRDGRQVEITKKF